MEAGTLLGHYRIIAKLGEGGMGAVYAAEDTKLGRQVALKLLPARVVEDPERRQRFEREARAVAAITHPNIVVLYAFEEADGTHFLTMEHVEGDTLDEVIPDDGLSLEQFLELALPLVGAIDAAHESGVIHRDLKPGNIMVTGDGLVKVLDFGLAKLSDIARDCDAEPTPETELPTQYATEPGHVFGTVPYMSPEQLRGEPADRRSDVFSLGVVLYEMAAGVNPFRRETRSDTSAAILKEEPSPLAQAATGLPAGLRAVLQRMLNKEPEARPQLRGEVAKELEKCRAELSGPITAAGQLSALGRTARRPHVAVPLVLVGALVAYFAYQAIDQASQARWARQVALPELERLAGRGIFGTSSTMWQAHELASQAAEAIPDDPLLATLWLRVARDVSIVTDPPGARLYGRPYPETDGEWRLMGTTPLEIRIPHGHHRFRIEKQGYRTRELLALGARTDGSFTARLTKIGTFPDEMVAVTGGTDELRLRLPGFERLREPVSDFLMDRFEVTNREYKEFLDDAGYTTIDYWQDTFLKEGRVLSWEEAMGLFVDKTGRPGPSTWEVGDYPEGEENYPVAGVSWYEAAAYAEFVDKRLPTVFHWARAAWTATGAEVVPLSNFGGAGPAAVGSAAAINMYGTHDLGGNVREWVLNTTEDPEQRFILGGGWSDLDYAFVDPYAQPAFDRSEINGIRLMRDVEPQPDRKTLEQPLERPYRDFLSEQPVADEMFEVYLRQFDYDKIALDAVEEVPIEEEDWIHHTISFSAAYGGERMSAHILLPKAGEPPFQAVILFPGSGALNQPSSAAHVEERTQRGVDPYGGFFVRSGRALVYPVYKSTGERQDELGSTIPNETTRWKNHVIMWVQDFSRTIDYLDTRDDLDMDKLAYYGVSWGGVMGAIVPAVEKRLKASVLFVGGLGFERTQPEVDPINYIGRVTLPVLMLNGRHDYNFPVETSQEPMLELFGTAEGGKNLQIFPGIHSVPPNDLIRESLAWLDKYLGPVGQ